MESGTSGVRQGLRQRMRPTLPYGPTVPTDAPTDAPTDGTAEHGPIDGPAEQQGKLSDGADYRERLNATKSVLVSWFSRNAYNTI